MQIYKVELTKERLAAMPVEERRALLLLGHAVNEINVLQKLLMMSRTGPAPHEVVDRVEGGQALILMRVLIGKLHEAWELFKQRIQADTQLRAKYLGNGSAECRALLEKLNRRFGNKSPLTEIRNQLAFHYTDKTNLVVDNFQHLSASEPWDLYVAQTAGNSFYWASELVTTASMVRLANPRSSGHPDDFGRLLGLVKDVAGDIARLFDLILADIIDAMDVEAVAVEIGPPTKLSLSPLPFFFDEVDLLLRSARCTDSERS